MLENVTWRMGLEQVNHYCCEFYKAAKSLLQLLVFCHLFILEIYVAILEEGEKNMQYK